MQTAELIAPHLTNLFNNVLQNKEAPTEYRNCIIVPLPEKGDLSDCNNWRGITLLSIRQWKSSCMSRFSFQQKVK